MSVVSLLGVKVLTNPAPFSAPYEFEITFECLEQLQKGNIVTNISCLISLTIIQIWSGSSLMLAPPPRKLSHCHQDDPIQADYLDPNMTRSSTLFLLARSRSASTSLFLRPTLRI
jgi:hypothetical protein